MILKRLLSKIWQSACMINDKIFYHGADFGKWKEIDELGIDESHGNPYQTSTVGPLKRVFNTFNISETDTLLDIGCGKGRTMYILSGYPFAQIDGYDISEELVETANKNFKLLHVEDRCHAFVGDAETFNEYDKYNYFYCFNSVPLDVFKYVVTNIQESLKRNPRKITFIYMHPVEEQYLLDNSDLHLVSRQKSSLSLAIDWFDLAIYSNQ